MGITLRTALLSWLVTLVTLLIFVMVIIPEQKRALIENLESKAHGVAVSLHDVAAGAAVNEDYSSVVDHCKEMLNGDQSLDYLVITEPIPAGASAKCRDGTYSFSEHHRGTCSHHGGVASWL